jgi:SAM-dependent methyltransferase
MKTVTNINSKVYYRGQYWNNIPQVLQYICKNFTGDENKWWIEDFKERYASKPFQHGLFLNCGDGRWEREFIDKKIVNNVTAFDVSPDLLEKARKLKEKRSIKYILVDANKIKLEKSCFDLIVNIAALHHVQYINRLCKILAESLSKDGYFVNFDYVGPYRNQYSWFNWTLIRMTNRSLPYSIRKSNLAYPHLPTMLKMDSTEAIHSNLILQNIYRYFNVIERHDTGGGVAYELFTHNNRLLDEKLLDSKEVRSQIGKVLKLDHFLTKSRFVPNFFTYLIAAPGQLDIYKARKYIFLQEIENLREKYSLKLENTYTVKDYAILIKRCKSRRGRLRMFLKYLSIKKGKFIEILRCYFNYFHLK